MKRIALTAVWILGSTLPLLAGTVLLFGCCVLPFHRVVHKVMPLCHMAVAGLAGDAQNDDATPAPRKQEPVKRVAARTIERFAVDAATRVERAAPIAAMRYRSFITLGATRCDQDVGWNVVIHALLI